LSSTDDSNVKIKVSTDSGKTWTEFVESTRLQEAQDQAQQEQDRADAAKDRGNTTKEGTTTTTPTPKPPEPAPTPVPAPTGGKKSFVATLQSYTKVSELERVYGSRLQPNDRVKMAIGGGISQDQINFVKKLNVKVKAAASNNAADLIAFAPGAKDKGFNYLSYALEKGHSPDSEVADPEKTMKQVRAAADKYGLGLVVATSRAMTDQYCALLAKYGDAYHMQLQAKQDTPDIYLDLAKRYTSVIRKQKPGIFIDCQISTQQDTIPGKSIQDTFKTNWQNVKQYMDATTIFYANTKIDEVKNFLDWFNQSGR
jgi:hypothetical protein